MDQVQTVKQKAIIHLYGLVQGVGFRPFALRLAQEYGICGFVKNESSHVLIEAVGDVFSLSCFMEALYDRRPTGSEILRFEKRILTLTEAENHLRTFTIERSVDGNEKAAVLSPDIALCDDCLEELFTPGNSRYKNPFISCTHCGPRFSIIRRIPYDRANTSMDSFPLCPLCDEQYKDSADRRFHAQTVCCNNCGPRLSYLDRSAWLNDQTVVLNTTIEALKNGKIIAIKGIGGYHFACDPFNEETLRQLRSLKGREHKPFAVMFPGIEDIKKYCMVSDEEEALLKSSARPIALLFRKASAIATGVYTSSPYLGAFLPYTPLHHLILRQTGPLVMTSANISSEPIIKDDEEMLRFFEQQMGLAGVLLHNRPILRRLDDSVVFAFPGGRGFSRRARGYVPLPIATPIEDGPASLACGSQEKNTFCLYKNGLFYLSGETGDLDSTEAATIYGETIADMQNTLGIAPHLAVCDLHPNYQSTIYAESIGIPVLKVQHHFAHIASVMAEHSLDECVIGVAFDGTGYGTDGTVWGGEFLIAYPDHFIRAGHLKPIKLLASDASINQGWKSAACMLREAGIPFDPSDNWQALVYTALEHNINTLYSSSMGRVFDAVSSILGICQESGYNGQCAIELENAAVRYYSQRPNAAQEPLPFSLFEERDATVADLSPAVRMLYEAKKSGEMSEALAFRFHITICRLVEEMCLILRNKYHINKVALSGGVFQNRLLAGESKSRLKKAGFTVYMNEQVPSGDGGISLGQAYVGLWTKEKERMAKCALQFPED